MKNMQKQIIYYSITFLISFFLGLLFNHYVLCKNFCSKGEQEGELEVVLQKEEGLEQRKGKDRVIKEEEGCTIFVDVSGALVSPGVYCLDSDALVIDAVNKAGGLRRDAGTKFIARKINLAQPLVNNQKLYFPYEKELICALEPLVDESIKIEEMMNTPVIELPTKEPYTDSDQTNVTPPVSDPNNSTNNGVDQCVNVNSATKEQLMTLNGVGEVTAEKIIQGRPYTHIDDLLNVSGIGESTLAKFKEDICI
jgi:competence protein ComEA